MVRRKHFPCGHIGLGRFCHRCARMEKAEPVAPASSARTRSMSASPRARHDDPVDLSTLPSEKIAERARDIIRDILRNSVPYTNFGGKRLNYDRTLISVPLGRNYRLLFREGVDGGKTAISALSHEDYNHKKPGRR